MSVVDDFRPASDETEHLQISVLFCDLAGHGQLVERLDEQALFSVMGSYREAGAALVERHVGHIVEYAGDGLLAYFGYPEAGEDHAERAVRAGLGMLGSFVDVNGSLQARHGVGLSVRVAVHSGPVVIREAHDGRWTMDGQTVNVAARLQCFAEPDTLVISDATLRLVTGLFVVEDLGTPKLKGVTEPPRAYRVLPAAPSAGER